MLANSSPEAALMILTALLHAVPISAVLGSVLRTFSIPIPSPINIILSITCPNSTNNIPVRPPPFKLARLDVDSSTRMLPPPSKQPPTKLRSKVSRFEIMYDESMKQKLGKTGLKMVSWMDL